MKRMITSLLGLLLILSVAPAFAESPNRAWEIQYDKRNIRRVNGMVRNKSSEMLRIPTYVTGVTNFTMAKTAPEVDFGIVQLTPEYLPDSVNAEYTGWGDATIAPDGRYIFQISNHMGYDGANAYMIAYGSQTKTHTTLFDTQSTCGWTNSQWGDGKLHGTPIVDPDGNMWVLTFYGVIPEVADYGTTYFGGWLIHHNLYTHQSECLGHPVADDSWPLYIYDWQRDRLYGVGEWGRLRSDNVGGKKNKWGKVVVYDTNSRQVLHGDFAKAGTTTIQWHSRSLLLDQDTGIVYGSEIYAPYRLAKYDPTTNTFAFMSSQLRAPLRAWTKQKKAGMYWVADNAGNLYRFWPAQDRLEYVTKNWISNTYKGTYMATLEISPGGRYLYYVAGSQREGGTVGMPIIQYDTKTNKRKVLAFLSDYYQTQYGYTIVGSYTLTLSRDGGSVFLQVNGGFTPGRQYINRAQGRPAMFHLHIPATERPLDD